ncbi:putative nucleotidyltransferase substrate binding domain protein [compost metagenome]
MSNEASMNEVSFQTIRSASSPAELRKARIEEQNRLFEQFSDTEIVIWNELVNELHNTVMSRASALCEQELIEEGFGPPPVPYAYVVFGSAGRAEQTLWSDQDNGLIIGESNDGTSESYFDEFGPRLSHILEVAGYPPCPGNVMLSNTLWRKSVADWERQLQYWRGLLGWEQVRYLMIAADMRHIYGDEELTKLLRKKMTAVFELEAEPEYDLTAAVLRNTIRHKAALNALGQVITEQTGEHAGEFDVKYGLYLPVVNAVRYLSIEYGIVASSTQERIEQLYRLDAAQLRWLDSCQHAFNTALRFRSMAAVKDEDGLLTGTNYLPETLIRQKEMRRELREALSTVKLMYRTLQRQHRYTERKWL